MLDRLLRRHGWDLLRPHERAVLEAVAGALTADGADLLRRQVDRIVLVTRMFSGTSVMLYPPKAERGSSGPAAFPARGPELRLATVTLRDAGDAAVRARLDAVWGDVFEISFSAKPSAGLRVVAVKLLADPMDPLSGTPGAAGSALASLPPAAQAEYQRLLSRGLPIDGDDAGLLAPDALYGIDVRLESMKVAEPMIVVGTVRDELIVVSVDGGAIRRVTTDGDGEPFPSIEAALRSGR